MLNSVWGVMRAGKVELTEQLDVEEGSRVLVTALPIEAETELWTKASEASLNAIWDNPEDDVYAELLGMRRHAELSC